MGWNHPSLCWGSHAHIIRTVAHTEAPFVRSCHETKTLKYGYCYIMAAVTSKAYGVIQAHSSSSSRQHSEKTLNGTSVLYETAVLLVPIAVEPYNDARTLTNTHRSTVRGCHQGKLLKRDCCTVAAYPLTAATVVLQTEQQRERGEK